jgi:fatty-acyl-CoA synthase
MGDPGVRRRTGRAGPSDCQSRLQAAELAFDPALVLELLEAERAAVFLGVPTMMIAVLGHPDIGRRDLSSLRVAVSGGAPVPAELVRQVEARLGVRFSIVFGSTECSPLLTQTKLDDSDRDRAETLGSPLPQTDVQITDIATGEPVPVGQVGELCARGYMVMRGYHDAPEATAAVIDADGWYHSGDLASIDDRGYLRIEGRIKDMIIRAARIFTTRDRRGPVWSPRRSRGGGHRRSGPDLG